MTTPTHLRLNKTTPHFWQVSFDSPPINLITPGLVTELNGVVEQISTDPDLKIVVFDSANDAFFLSHFDLAQAAAFPTQPDGTPTWTDTVLRLSHSPVISVAVIRGRARGGGNEFALACDLRYASRERALLGQPEVGTGILPGGGATERLPRLVGRDRALEAVLSSDDYDADTAERFGWVTRALPDADLHQFVHTLVTRIETFDRDALSGAKAQINRASLPADADLIAAYGEYFVSLTWPGFRARGPRLAQLGAQHGADVELRLGHYLGLET